MVAANPRKLILADTSVWIDHFRRGNSTLARAVADHRIAMHDFVFGELFLGSLPRRSPDTRDLRHLPVLPAVETDACIEFINKHGLVEKGLGWIDAHLLASASQAEAKLWTLDSSLRQAADRLSLFEEP